MRFGCVTDSFMHVNLQGSNTGKQVIDAVRVARLELRRKSRTQILRLAEHLGFVDQDREDYLRGESYKEAEDKFYDEIDARLQNASASARKIGRR